ncbi:hypothetical protein KDW_45840 [Dictyobacter vulcani]|uniref:Uncharacterized protein n=1 Tax=Dictyobacter vulcani TaxID=2607529 RepID=A0A5J4KTC8_9CHLR|nr:hypothetical protein KDW_45840 [Dictyobacter vulcani]
MILRTGTGRIHAISTTLLREQATAPTIPVGATALRVVLARWPAQTQQCGLRVWRPLTYTLLAGHVQPSLNVSLSEKY